MADAINNHRLALWDQYYEELLPLQEKGLLRAAHSAGGCVHNAHMFFISKQKDLKERTALLAF